MVVHSCTLAEVFRRSKVHGYVVAQKSDRGFLFRASQIPNIGLCSFRWRFFNRMLCQCMICYRVWRRARSTVQQAAMTTTYYGIHVSSVGVAGTNMGGFEHSEHIYALSFLCFRFIAACLRKNDRTICIWHCLYHVTLFRLMFRCLWVSRSCGLKGSQENVSHCLVVQK